MGQGVRKDIEINIGPEKYNVSIRSISFTMIWILPDLDFVPGFDLHRTGWD